MKKILFIFIILLLSGCNNKRTGNEPVSKILSFGKLSCILKQQNLKDNTIYTSYYIYDFDNYGVLKGLTNYEEISFDNSKDEIKDKYKESIDKIVNEYKDIKGIKVEYKYENSKYYFNVDIDKDKLSEDLYKVYLLDKDRISLYNFYTNNKYTCE